MTDLPPRHQWPSAQASSQTDQPFVLDEGMSLTLRTAVFRLGTDGPVYAHLDLGAGQRSLCLQLYDATALYRLATALQQMTDDTNALLLVRGVYPAPRIRTATVPAPD